MTIPSRTLQEIGGPEKLRITTTPGRNLSTLPIGQPQKVPMHLVAEYAGQHDDRVTVTPADVEVTLTAPAPRNRLAARPRRPDQRPARPPPASMSTPAPNSSPSPSPAPTPPSRHSAPNSPTVPAAPAAATGESTPTSTSPSTTDPRPPTHAGCCATSSPTVSRCRKRLPMSNSASSKSLPRPPLPPRTPPRHPAESRGETTATMPARCHRPPREFHAERPARHQHRNPHPREHIRQKMAECTRRTIVTIASPMNSPRARG